MTAARERLTVDNVTNADLATVTAIRTARALAATGNARRIRQDARLSMAEVAAVVGVSPSAVSRWERGERAPQGLAAIRYARVLVALLDEAQP